MRFVIACLALLLATAVHAQAWPDRAVHLIVPFTPGGAQDVIARLVADKLGAALRQPVVVENKAGAGGVIAAQEVAHAAPDGHTLLLSTGAQITIAPSLQRQLTYDPVRDFTHIVHLLDTPLVLLANPDVPVKTVKEVVDYAKAHGGQLNCASTGNGTYTHLTLELFKSLTGADITHVPYKGASPAFTDLTSTNRLRPIAVTSSRRTAMLPDVPTFAEAGVAGLDVSVWIGISAPAKTPASIVERLNAEINRLLKEKDVQARLAQLGAEPAGGTAAQFGAMVQADAQRWAELIRKTGIKVE
jgi:tripartite-type tricarboxylate transporter receptor subunit TctC